MNSFKSTAAMFAASCAFLAAGPAAAQTKPWPVIEEKAPATEVRAIPGDTFEPRTIPGDTFEPKAIPGDTFIPKEPLCDPRTKLSGGCVYADDPNREISRTDRLEVDPKVIDAANAVPKR